MSKPRKELKHSDCGIVHPKKLSVVYRDIAAIKAGSGEPAVSQQKQNPADRAEHQGFWL